MIHGWGPFGFIAPLDLGRDPFSEALSRAAMPVGLLGRSPTPAECKLAEHFGAPSSEWTPEQWVFALDVVGHMEMVLQSRLANEIWKHKPGKVGRPRKPNFDEYKYGLLSPPPVREVKRRGRKPKWTDQPLRYVYEAVEERRRQLGLDAKAAIDKFIHDLAEREGASYYRYRLKHLGAISNAYQRAKKRFS